MSTGADFSLLPEVAWVKIMEYLSLAERSRVASTCRSLNAVFNHPSLWHTVKMFLLGDTRSYQYRVFSPLILSNQYKEMATRFGVYFQQLTVRIMGFVKRVPPEVQLVISELSKDCRLEKLELEIGTMVSKDDLYSVKPINSELKAFAMLVDNAFRLKSFNLVSWPRYSTKKTIDVLDSLIENAKIRGLAELKLFSFDPTRGSWITNNAVVPSAERTLFIVQHFTQLTSLSMRWVMFSEELLEELASPSRVQLKHLEFLVTYTDKEKEFGITSIPSQSWKRLKDTCPELQVKFSLLTRIPSLELMAVLSPDIPLHSLSFMRYSQCSRVDIMSIVDKYSDTLQHFADYTDASDCHVQLLALVTNCKLLKQLIYYGKVHTETVISMAELRGHNWEIFCINGDNVVTEAHDESLNVDDDVVIRVGPDGKLSTPLLRYHGTDEFREAKMAEMNRRVSQALCFKWTPETEATMFTF